ncbi:MAG: hypothetical protein ACTSRW_15990 [Candidatus Helarchaeota archaeon]
MSEEIVERNIELQTKDTKVGRSYEVVIPKKWREMFRQSIHEDLTDISEQLSSYLEARNNLKEEMVNFVRQYHEIGSNEIQISPVDLSNDSQKMKSLSVSVLAQIDHKGQLVILEPIRKFLPVSKNSNVRMEFDEKSKIIRLIIMKKEKQEDERK